MCSSLQLQTDLLDPHSEQVLCIQQLIIYDGLADRLHIKGLGELGLSPNGGAGLSFNTQGFLTGSGGR